MSDYMSYTEVTFIQIIDNRSFVLKCRYCGGRGMNVESILALGREIAYWNDDNPCPICKGKTALRLISDDIPMACGQCTGTGRDRAIYMRAATEEDRMRVIPVKKCGLCDGLGVLSLTGAIKILR